VRGRRPLPAKLERDGWPPLRREELLRQRARDLCEDFLSGLLPPRRLTHELYRTAVDLDYPADLSAWVGLDDCWTLIGLYHRDEAELEEEIRHEAYAFIAITPKRFY
jgi:hypothetical protein